MQTALQELIHYCQNQMESLNGDNTIERMVRITFYDIVAHIHAEELLEKERQQIGLAFMDGKTAGGLKIQKNGEDYYNKTYQK